MPKIKGWDKGANPNNPLSWRNRITGNYLAIHFGRNKNWIVVSEDKVLAKFNTKKEALKYAIDWMRNHPTLSLLINDAKTKYFGMSIASGGKIQPFYEMRWKDFVGLPHKVKKMGISPEMTIKETIKKMKRG